MMRILIALMLMTSVAFAQDKLPEKFKLELTPVEVQTIGTALMELPKKIADPIVQQLNKQVQPQIDALNKKPEVKK